MDWLKENVCLWYRISLTKFKPSKYCCVIYSCFYLVILFDSINLKIKISILVLENTIQYNYNLGSKPKFLFDVTQIQCDITNCWV